MTSPPMNVEGRFMAPQSATEYPPMALIKTWVWMMIESTNPEIQEKGKNNLISAFGSLAKANNYIASLSQN